MSLLALLVSLAIVGIIRGNPNSVLGRTLRIYLAEKPIEAVSKIERHHVIWIGVLVLTALSASEIAAVFGTDFFIAYTFDVSLYLDAVFVAAALAATSRLRTAVQLARAFTQRSRREMRSSRNRLPRPRAKARRHAPKRPHNDEDGPLSPALAA